MPKYSRSTKRNIENKIVYSIAYREGNRIVIQSTKSTKVLAKVESHLTANNRGFTVSMKRG